MKVVCLTGGIASGKSTAVKYLASKGANVIDADLLGHQVYAADSPGFHQVVAVFGEDVIAEGGGIDRRALGQKVFGKPEALKQLTDVVWPEIRRLAESEIVSLRKSGALVVVLEAAVLFEAGWQDIGDEVWVVTVEPELAISRAMTRDSMPREAIENRLAAQLSNAEREALADTVIANDGDQKVLLDQLDLHWAAL